MCALDARRRLLYMCSCARKKSPPRPRHRSRLRRRPLISLRFNSCPLQRASAAAAAAALDIVSFASLTCAPAPRRRRSMWIELRCREGASERVAVRACAVVRLGARAVESASECDARRRTTTNRWKCSSTPDGTGNDAWQCGRREPPNSKTGEVHKSFKCLCASLYIT